MRSARIAGLVLAASGMAAVPQAPFHWQWRKIDDGFYQRPILRQMKINQDDRVAMIDAVAASLKADKDTFGGVDAAELWDIAANESYEWVDLNANGAPELVTQAFGVDACGGTDNCVLQVFRRHGLRLELVLYTRAESLMVNRSAGRTLLVLYSHESAAEGDLAVYSLPHYGNAIMVHHYGVSWAGDYGSGPAYSHPHLEVLPTPH